MRRCFNPTQAEEVLSIPLSSFYTEDMLILGRTDGGVFTVKSGTKVAGEIDVTKLQNESGSCSRANDGRWGRTWGAMALTPGCWCGAHAWMKFQRELTL